VPQGGTGAATLTANGVLYGSGASAIAATAVGTTGQVLVGNTGAAPSWATLTGIGVTSFSAGTTGFTPSTATTGAITLAGTLGVANGGTGTTTAFTAGSVVFAGASGVYTQDNANFFWDNANDRLGIGINTPAIKLQVSDVDQATARIGVRNANGQNYHLVAGTPGASNTGFAIFDATASATRMYITSAGVVGIGTTSPLAGFRLDVSGSANASGSFISGGGTTNQAQIGNKVLLFYNTSVGEGLIQSADDASTFNSMGIDKTTLRFLTNNTERARITSTGGLAVGTTTDPGAGNIGLAAGKFLQFSSTAYMTPEDNVAGARIVTPGAFNLATGGTAVRMTVDGSGNVGIGVAPSAWGGSTPAIQILRASLWGAANNSYQGSNYYYDGSDRRYIGSDFAAEYAQLTGNHLWYTAASGTAGNVISFSERMRITPDGNVGIGTSSPFTRLEVNSGTGTAPVLSVYATNPAFGAEDVLGTIGFGSNGSGNNIQAASISGVNETASSSTNGILRFSTRTAASVTEKMRLTSAGNLLVGTTSTELGGSFKNVILEGGDGGIFQVQTPSAAQKMAISVDSSAGYVGTRTNNPLVFNTNNTERMRITSAGNVGIGTTTPVTRLHVSQSNSGDYASVALLSNSADAAADRTGIYGSPAPGTANPYRGGITFWPGSSGAVSIHTGNNATPGAGERMRIDGSGNVGVGVTPSAWSGYGPPVIQLQNNGTMVASGSSLYLGANWYYSGGNFLYNTTDFATYYQQISGQHRFFNAPSGTVGNAITFTQAMTLDASGNLLVGNTTPFYNNAGRGLINVNGSSQSFIGFGIAGAGKGYLACVSNTFAMESENGLDIKLNAIGSNTVQMWTNNTERARIDGSGNLLVGTTTASALGTQSKFRTSGNGGGANASIGTVSGAGTGAVDTLIPINQSSFGGTALLLASRNTSDGLNTLSAVYLVTFYFDGNNAPAKTLIAGTDFVTFGVSGSQTLTLTNAGGGNVTYAWFGNK
jgi:hypothetical protein